MIKQRKLPSWLRKKKDLSGIREIRSILRRYKLSTVCEEAKCPNISECFQNRTATFMILGKNCTRNCSFCAVSHEEPFPVSEQEPKMIADMIKELGLKYIVITSVTRDDLKDGGSGQFCRVINICRENIPDIKIEVLIPDFQGDMDQLDKILKCRPNILNHNLETVPSLYKTIRPLADYERSLNILRISRDHSKGDILTKTGIIIGLGESIEEIYDLFNDIKDLVDIVTIGQYLSPTRNNYPEKKFYTIKEFEEIEKKARDIGIRHIISGPYVRSSYNACSVYEDIK